jgi:hypothetical protein
MLLSLLWTPASHAIVYWDDELESGNTGYPDLVANGHTCGGSVGFEYDTSNKISGTASLKMNYPGLSFYNLCGGFADRAFTPSDDIWIRLHIRLSSGWITSTVTTKLPRIDQTASSLLKNWLVMVFSGTSVFLGAENYPSFGSTVNIPPNAGDANLRTNPEGQWVCIEVHLVNNTPGVANGVYQAYKNGDIFANYSDRIWRRADNGGANSHWDNIRLFRQNGGGSINYDRLAVGNTRMGCVGGGAPPDTTPPATPTGLTVN